jgi:hypothetical protein
MKKVIKHGFRSYLGIPPEYEDRYTINSKSKYNIPYDGENSILLLTLGSNVVQIEQEER